MPPTKVNVNRSIEDTFYRYKMPLIEAKVEGRGNGIKTVIPNMVDVAKALDRPPNYTCKYIGVELGAQTTMDAENDRYIVNGEFDATRFQDLLDGFIKKFVLCTGCGNPETKLRVTSKKLIEAKCIACGHRCHLPMVHKLTTYIINNPPNGEGPAGKGKGKKGGKSKEERRAAKNAKANGGKGRAGSSSDAPGAGGDTIDETAQGVSRANIDQRANGGQIDAPDAVEDGGDEDEEWSVDTSEEAVRARTEGLGAATQFTATEDLEKSMSSRLDIFNAFVEEKSKLEKLPAKEVLGEAERLEVKDKGIMVLVSILWNTDDVPAAMKKYQGLFQRFMMENGKAQMYALHAMEKLIELDPTRLAKTPRYLKTMYDLDLIDEEVFVAWETKFAKQVSKDLSGKIRTAGAAFLSWIKEAEEEESSEDENVAFESAPMANPVKAKAAAKEPEPEEDEDDDLDIDDM